jgi:hypothetical protein
MMRWTWVLLVAAGLVAVGSGCSSRKPALSDPGGIGDPCEDNEGCREDLDCRADFTCGPGGDAAVGEACTYAENCADGLACVWEMGRDAGGNPIAVSVCRAAGTAGRDEFCATTLQCEAGLVCVANGFGGTCRPGATVGDLGDTCTTLEDCHAGLVCGTGGVCVRARDSSGGPGYPIWEGIDCGYETEGVARFYFEVPRGPLEAGHDFFRLPWPNDIRRTADGHLDLTDFPHPALPGLPVDVVDRFLRASEEDLTGYGTNGAVFFRSSQSIDWGTVVGDSTIYWVDLTPPASPTDRHSRLGFGWGASTGGGRYLCQNWLAVRSGLLLPNRTYAVVLTAGVHDSAGNVMTRDPDFEQMLRPSRPTSEAALGAAWDAYAPFRAYLAHDAVDSGTILVAAVFTTQDFPATLQAAKTVVDALPAPGDSGLVRCAAGVHSVCADDDLPGEEQVRGCFGESAAYDELQSAFATAIFQQGSEPYRTPDAGGGFVFDAMSGAPEVQREEDVCFSLTVPRGVAMPADGWPLVIYTHGTGGSYRSFITSGIADDLTSVTLADGSVQHFAVLSYDQPEHGHRRGGSAEAPELLFYNFMNPRAAWGNVLQGAIDGFMAAKYAIALNLDAATSPTGAALSFDPTRIYYYGHSQGATHGVLTAAFDASFDALVLSGAGGSLIESLLYKTSPLNVAGAVRMALADPDIGGMHPALTVFQMYLEAADPLNYAKYLVWQPIAPLTPKDVLMVYGLGDTYSTKETQQPLAGAIGGLPIAEPVIDSFGDAWPTVTLPVSGNWNPSGELTTAVLSQHNPAAGADGHFVATEDDVARRRVAQFLATAARDGTPTVVP